MGRTHLTLTASIANTLAVVLLSLFFGSCSDVENEFSKERCYLIIDNSVHQDHLLAAAMNANAPGFFCSIEIINDGGVQKFRFKAADGQASEPKPLNGVDVRRGLIVGLNNGVIVGFGNLNNPATFYAFDRECPNCFDPNQIPLRSKPLSIAANGQAKCNVCKRQYDMNNGGNISNGDGGKKLTRYRASTTGPLGVLSVN